MRVSLVIIAALGASGCLRQAEDRAQADLEMGTGAVGDVAFAVHDGLAAILELDTGRLGLWAQTPDLRITAEVGSAATPEWTISVDNAMPGAELTAVAGGVIVPAARLPSERPTEARWQLTLPVSSRVELRVAPPDADVIEPYRFVVMGDIQTALARVHEVFARINQEPGVRFVASTGDVVEEGERYEYELMLAQLRTLEVPYFSTIGNHEVFGDTELWREYFGRFNLHFGFKGARLSMVDSGSASLDPMVYDWLDGWMAAAGDAPHLFFTHFPPLDPVGVRAGSFRSRKEASKLLARLAAGGVDATLYGHIHSLYEFENAGIPARISGGGGAWPEKLDGIGRHFLVVEVDGARAGEPGGGVIAIEVVRVD
ncbi:MAG TPA: metallophosphoesterase [Kofleriaceae bacterium]|nr:metallophosphoesterase [Kofleriaceae bacterium]